MDVRWAEFIFLIFIAATFIIRWPYVRLIRKNQIVDDRKTTLEKYLLFGAWLGMMFLPTVYILTPFLDTANYNIPPALNILGLILLITTAWLFYMSHRDLGTNWSVTLEVRQDHILITDGIYEKIRHPMYTSIWLWVIAQALILNNYIAGLSGIVFFGLLYFLRVKKEEQMMIKQFGAQYIEYMWKTNRLFPKIKKS